MFSLPNHPETENILEERNGYIIIFSDNPVIMRDLESEKDRLYLAGIILNKITGQKFDCYAPMKTTFNDALMELGKDALRKYKESLKCSMVKE